VNNKYFRHLIYSYLPLDYQPEDPFGLVQEPSPPPKPSGGTSSDEDDTNADEEASKNKELKKQFLMLMRQQYTTKNDEDNHASTDQGDQATDTVMGQWEMIESERQYESACLCAMVEQMSKVDRAIVEELIRKERVEIKIPGGVYSKARVADQIENIGKSIDMCKAVKIEVSCVTEEDKESKKKDKKEKKEKKTTRSSGGYYANGFCSAMLEVMSPSAAGKINESEQELLRILPVLKISNN
jgi:hypothetical protein